MSILSPNMAFGDHRSGQGCERALPAGGHSTAEIAHAAKCELAEKTLRRFGQLRCEVTGFSMLPSVWPGDLLLISPAGDGANLSGRDRAFRFAMAGLSCTASC